MKTLHIKKGFTHPLTEKIAPGFENKEHPEKIGMVPFVIKGIKPKLAVTEGEKVKIGEPLFYDKNNPNLVFLSPGGGTISKIITGSKRAIKKIEILLDETEDYEELDSVTESALRNISDDDLRDVLLKNGVWPYFRSLPFNTIPFRHKTPSKIFVKMSDNAPYYPLPETWLKHRLKAFNHGLAVMKKIAPEVIVYADKGNHYIKSECENSINYLVSGNYPAFSPGAIEYNIRKKNNKGEIWYIDGQNLVALGETLLHGQFFTEKVFVVGGSEIETPYHVRSRAGAPYYSLLNNDSSFDSKQRFISGDIYSGFIINEIEYTGFYESSLSIIPEGDEKKFFAFIKPGFDRPSFSKTFASRLTGSKVKTDCNTNGEKRACINCSYCESVCPVDILPQYTMKALYADDIDAALSHGLLDCIECSLCSYVCPSKISLSRIFAQAKDNYHKEEKAD